MKIAVNLLPFTSYQGTETFAVNLLKSLADQLNSDDELILLVHEKSPEWLQVDHENVEQYSVSFPFSGIKGVRALYQQTFMYWDLWKIKPDVLLSPSPSNPFFYRKSAVTIHDCAYDKFPEFRDFLSKCYFKSMFYAAKFFAKSVITISDFSKKELIDVYQISSSKIDVISEGPPDLPSVEKDFIDKTLRKYDISSPYFFYIGNARPRKNLKGLLESFAKFTKSNKDFKLVLAGKIDTDFLDVEAIINDLGVGDSVFQTGFISEEEKVALYKEATALAFPSMYEGFGLPILEAQSLGTPVITSNITSMPEVAGDAAKLVDPKNTDDIVRGMQKVADDEGYRRKLSVEGKENVKRFSWDKAAQRLLKSLRKNF